MKITPSLSDAAILGELGARLAQTRLDLDLTQEQLAAEAGVSKRTLERLEAGESAQLASYIRVLRALGLAGQLDSVIPEPLASPLAQLKLQGRKRARASRSASRAKTRGGGWRWDEDA
jgi:transcriptional regulator with XRE-family HTH domain